MDKAFADLRARGGDPTPAEMAAIADGVVAAVREAPRSRGRPVVAGVAAALFLAVAGVGWGLRGRGQVVAGMVRLDTEGAGSGSSLPIETDRWIEVPLASTAHLEIHGAGMATLGRGSLLRVHGRREDGRAVLELARGCARFEGAPGAPGFEVRLPCGSVREVGTAYSAYVVDLAGLLGTRGEWPAAALVDVVDGEVEISNAAGRQRILPSHVGFLIDGCAPAFRERGGEIGAYTVEAQLAAVAGAARAGAPGDPLRLLELASAARRDREPFETFLRGTGGGEDARRLARALLDLEPTPDAAR
ncbi:MAG: hypothetical protein HY608_02260 [Planctomycetes bacterium]|nr:hypothetical protein [Planctomycetota bacterium]